MNIILADNIGFCNGVEKSITETNKILEKEKTFHCLGELVHNEKVIDELKNKGLIIVDKLTDEKEIIIRAHGIAKEIYDEINTNKINLIDLTCPKVLGIHKMAEKLASEENHILLIGNKKHPEVIGTISFCGKSSNIIQDEEDLNSLEIENDKIAIIGQTTYSLSKFNSLCELIKKKFKDKKIKIFNTLCDTTKNRQEEAKSLASKVDIMFIVGDKKSSNTNKLFEVASKINKNTFLIEDLEDLKKQNIEFNKNYCIGIITGASTPKSFALEIKKYLEERSE